jgi:hypothetical protein
MQNRLSKPRPYVQLLEAVIAKRAIDCVAPHCYHYQSTLPGCVRRKSDKPRTSKMAQHFAATENSESLFASSCSSGHSIV